MKKTRILPLSVLCITLLLFLGIPVPGAAADAAGGPQPLLTTADISVNNASLDNMTIPDKYQATPTLVEVGISTNGSSVGDGPKGEMAAGPRTIGFSISPEMIAILILVIALIGIGGWYLLRQRCDKKKEE